MVSLLKIRVIYFGTLSFPEYRMLYGLTVLFFSLSLPFLLPFVILSLLSLSFLQFLLPFLLQFLLSIFFPRTQHFSPHSFLLPYCPSSTILPLPLYVFLLFSSHISLCLILFSFLYSPTPSTLYLLSTSSSTTFLHTLLHSPPSFPIPAPPIHSPLLHPSPSSPLPSTSL